jgi:hypothetical protein
VLDPFCGSGSTLVAARDAGCAYLGIELDAGHHRTASKRMGLVADAAVVMNVPTPRPRSQDEGGWARPFTRYVEAA